MNFGHLQSSALDQELGTDDSTRLFTSARRQRAINQAQLTFCDLTECSLRQSTISCSNGVREYNLLSTVSVPAQDFLRLSKQGPEFHHTDSAAQVTYMAGDQFVRREIAWMNQYDPGWRASTGGTPWSYYERMDGGARYFGLHPPPTLATSSETGIVPVSYTHLTLPTICSV